MNKSNGSTIRILGKGKSMLDEKKMKEKGEASCGNSSDNKKRSHGKKFPFRCYNCGKKGHMAKECPQQNEEENAGTAQIKEGWEVNALMAHVTKDKSSQAK